MKRILITGASGFLGRPLMNLLAKEGCQIFPLSKEAGFDLFDTKKIKDVCQTVRADALIHLAWDTNPAHFWDSVGNIDWLRHSLELFQAFAQSGGKRVVAAGTCFEYLPDAKPTSLYAASKESLRIASEHYFKKMGVSFAWGRLFFPYGPHEKSERLIPLAIRSFLANKGFHCQNPDFVRDFIHIEDAALGFLALLNSSEEGSFDVCTGQGHSIRAALECIANELGSLDQLTFESKTSHPKPMVGQPPSFFTPKYSLEAGLTSTIHWWRNHLLAGNCL